MYDDSIFFAAMGKRPRSAKDGMSPGESIPESELIFASSLPALTWTMVPGNIPTCEKVSVKPRARARASDTPIVEDEVLKHIERIKIHPI